MGSWLPLILMMFLTAPLSGEPLRAVPVFARPTRTLDGLREGATVMVQSIDDEDLMATEGRVAGVDRCRGRITVKYDDGTVDVLRLTERAAAATWSVEEQAIAARAAGAQAAVYFDDEHGRRVVHFFRWVD